jgi:hypothetical protein
VLATLAAPELDWLDRGLVEARLGTLSTRRTHPSPPPALRTPSADQAAAIVRALADAYRRTVATTSASGRSEAVVRALATLVENDRRLARRGDALEVAEAVVVVAEQAARLGVSYTADCFSGAPTLGQPAASSAQGELSRAVRRLQGLGVGAEILDPLAGRMQEASAVERTMRSECAGIFLLTRVLLDVRVPSLVAGDALRTFLLVLGLRWMAEQAIVGGRVDPALAWWAGWDEPPPAAEVSQRWSTSDHRALTTSLCVMLRALRLVTADAPTVVGAVGDETTHGGEPDAERDADRCAIGLLRAWARWLPGYSSSSPAHLLATCIRRRGVVQIAGDHVEVHLEPGPVDVVIEMAGYFDPVRCAPWLGGRRLSFIRRTA